MAGCLLTEPLHASALIVVGLGWMQRPPLFPEPAAPLVT